MQKTLMANLIGFAVCIGSASSPALAAEAEQPNLAIIMTDDLGYDDLATYSHQIVKTPNVDRLVQEGTKFTNCYVPAPLNSPSCARLLAGRMPFHTGIRPWIPSGEDVTLGRSELTIANLLKVQGCDTAMMDKLYPNAGDDRTDQPRAQDMGFGYSLANMAGFATDATLDNARERPRYGVVYSTDWLRNG